MVNSLSLVIPNRNWPPLRFELSLMSLEKQSVPLHEIILLDIASNEYKDEMMSLCKAYGVRFIPLEVDLSDRAIEIFLWNTCINYGLKQATGDLIMYTGMDRIYESNMVDTVLKFYNWNLKQGREGLAVGSAWNIKRVPKKSDLNDLDKLFAEAKYRGGYAYWATSPEWIEMSHGLDESLRWYEDIDLARRMKRSGGTMLWTTKGGATRYIGQISKVLHVATHPIVRRMYGGDDIVELARRGKFYIVKDETITRNGDDWGVLTEEKLDRARNHGG